jgi:renalase
VFKTNPSSRVAVVGAGLAGAAAAHALVRAGHGVTVFDKSRGPGGRLATRRAAWHDRGDEPRTTRLDHGAPGFTAETERFRRFVDEAVSAGWLARWEPTLAPDSRPGADGVSPMFLPVPDMPRLCRELLGGVDCRWEVTLDGLHREADHWRLMQRGVAIEGEFDRVVLALPPVQAAPLLRDHAPEWAAQAASVAMQPCWTLLGISEPLPHVPAWDLARPADGPIACIVRNDRRPGREQRHDEMHWVLHARANRSQALLEADGPTVQRELEHAFDDWLDESVRWKHAVVHRWRYALPPDDTSGPRAECWWDAPLGLGVCGDFLGGQGAEGAWLSGTALADALLACTARLPAGVAA